MSFLDFAEFHDASDWNVELAVSDVTGKLMKPRRIRLSHECFHSNRVIRGGVWFAQHRAEHAAGTNGGKKTLDGCTSNGVGDRIKIVQLCNLLLVVDANHFVHRKF